MESFHQVVGEIAFHEKAGRNQSGFVCFFANITNAWAYCLLGVLIFRRQQFVVPRITLQRRIVQSCLSRLYDDVQLMGLAGVLVANRWRHDICPHTKLMLQILGWVSTRGQTERFDQPARARGQFCGLLDTLKRSVDVWKGERNYAGIYRPKTCKPSCHRVRYMNIRLGREALANRPHVSRH
jgi:hypothetical protein